MINYAWGGVAVENEKVPGSFLFVCLFFFMLCLSGEAPIKKEKFFLPEHVQCFLFLSLGERVEPLRSVEATVATQRYCFEPVNFGARVWYVIILCFSFMK